MPYRYDQEIHFVSKFTFENFFEAMLEAELTIRDILGFVELMDLAMNTPEFTEGAYEYFSNARKMNAEQFKEAKEKVKTRYESLRIL